MKTEDKQKLCWNCEGSTAVQDENCPYCGVYLSPLSIGGGGGYNSLFDPPYRLERDADREQIPASPYAMPENEAPPVAKESALTGAAQEKVETLSETKVTLIPLLLFLGGSTLFIFALLLLLFSEKGVLTLRWTGYYWPIYLFLAAPMLGFGWRFLQRIPDEPFK